jgi:2-polyprenyl-6-hydroxyphenyl methylase/3-demethylubiquinone-9 3-methyltransferase
VNVSHESAPLRGPSVDPDDIERFNRLGNLWWDKAGEMGVLHEINPIRVDYVESLACRYLHRDRHTAAPLQGLRLLDVGCGGGILSESLAELGAAVTGIDPAPNNVEVATRHALQSGLDIEYRNITAEALATQGETFDVVTALEVLEHVEGQKSFIATLSQLVKPGGLLFLATIDRTLKSYALAIVGAEYLLRWVPRGTHNHAKFVRPDELSGWLRAAGLREIDRAGMSYQPLTRQWRKSSDTDVNYLMTAKKDG